MLSSFGVCLRAHIVEKNIFMDCNCRFMLGDVFLLDIWTWAMASWFGKAHVHRCDMHCECAYWNYFIKVFRKIIYTLWSVACHAHEHKQKHKYMCISMFTDILGRSMCECVCVSYARAYLLERIMSKFSPNNRFFNKTQPTD